MDFFNQFKSKKDDDKNNNKNKNDKNNNNNPIGQFFQGLTGGGQPKAFSGEGKTLAGGSSTNVKQNDTNKNYKTRSIVLTEAGPLGIQVERRTHNNTSIVHTVVKDSQADQAGVQRGDIICMANTNGTQEMLYDQFLSMAKSKQRPVLFDIKRIATTTPPPNLDGNMSADAYHKKQMMIAAAEAREKKYKQATTTGIPKRVATTTTNTTDPSSLQEITTEPKSMESVMAMQLVKEQEKRNIAQLGYNPYEVKHMTSDQARHAVTATTHGVIQASEGAPPVTTTTSYPSTTTISNNNVSTISRPTTMSTNEQVLDDEQQWPSTEFEDAYEVFVTSHNNNSDHEKMKSTISILCKLITNATTAASNDKFRKIRLQNPKIQAHIVQVDGAIDILLSIGFLLMNDPEQVDVEEMILYFPEESSPPLWLPTALQRLQQYLQSLS